jgi:hypothetical protein
MESGSVGFVDAPAFQHTKKREETASIDDRNTSTPRNRDDQDVLVEGLQDHAEGQLVSVAEMAKRIRTCCVWRSRNISKKRADNWTV